MKRSIQQEKNQLDAEGVSDQPDDSAETRQAKLHKQEEDAAELKRIREQMRRDVMAYKDKIFRSEIYQDDNYQYRHVKLPPEIALYLPDFKKRKILLREYEYRQLGVDISSGWEHYMTYQPEPNILLLRRSHEVAKKVEEERQKHEKAKEAAGQTSDSKPGRRRLPKSKQPTAPTDQQ